MGLEDFALGLGLGVLGLMEYRRVQFRASQAKRNLFVGNPVSQKDVPIIYRAFPMSFLDYDETRKLIKAGPDAIRATMSLGVTIKPYYLEEAIISQGGSRVPEIMDALPVDYQKSVCEICLDNILWPTEASRVLGRICREKHSDLLF